MHANQVGMSQGLGTNVQIGQGSQWAHGGVREGFLEKVSLGWP